LIVAQVPFPAQTESVAKFVLLVPTTLQNQLIAHLVLPMQTVTQPQRNYQPAFAVQDSMDLHLTERTVLFVQIMQKLSHVPRIQQFHFSMQVISEETLIPWMRLLVFQQLHARALDMKLKRVAKMATQETTAALVQMVIFVKGTSARSALW
jgi:hypothetical protein